MPKTNAACDTTLSVPLEWTGKVFILYGYSERQHQLPACTPLLHSLYQVLLDSHTALIDTPSANFTV